MAWSKQPQHQTVSWARTASQLLLRNDRRCAQDVDHDEGVAAEGVDPVKVVCWGAVPDPVNRPSGISIPKMSSAVAPVERGFFVACCVCVGCLWVAGRWHLAH